MRIPCRGVVCPKNTGHAAENSPVNPDCFYILNSMPVIFYPGKNTAGRQGERSPIITFNIIYMWKESQFIIFASFKWFVYVWEFCIFDAAYRTTWIWKSCVLNGRKAFSRLFFRPKTVHFAHFSLESEPTGKLPFPVRSPPVFYPLRRYENKWDFHQLMSTKSKMQSRRFCNQKKKQAVSLVDLGKSVGLFGEAISFLPLVLTLL